MEATIYVVVEGKHKPSEIHSLSLPAKRRQQKKKCVHVKKVQLYVYLK